MRTTQILLWNKWKRNGRKPAKPPLRFTECKKLELKDRVTTNDSISGELACNSQILELMSCLKDNDFDQGKCSKQIDAFKICYSIHLENKSNKQRVATTRENRMSINQLNDLLQKYPQPR